MRNNLSYNEERTLKESALISGLESQAVAHKAEMRRLAALIATSDLTVIREILVQLQHEVEVVDYFEDELQKQIPQSTKDANENNGMSSHLQEDEA